MKFTIILSLVLFSFSAMAAKTKIAKCSIPANGNDPAGKISVVFLGGDTAVAKNYLVAYEQGEVNKVVPADIVNLAADHSSLELVFMRFITVAINEGETATGHIGVMLGAPAVEMTCAADFRNI